MQAQAASQTTSQQVSQQVKPSQPASQRVGEPASWTTQPGGQPVTTPHHYGAKVIYKPAVPGAFRIRGVHGSPRIEAEHGGYLPAGPQAFANCLEEG